MKTKLFAILMLAGSSLFARTHVSIGFGIGGYYPPAPVYVYSPPPRYYAAPVVRPAYPGPAYGWVDPYYYPAGPRWAYRAGCWARRPHPRAYWVRSRYYRSRWYGGYWR